jgi:lipopolysaccharide transport system ATP-binding protein
VWALKDVSFEVKQGEVVGIIGRNGAGKSTLLKILTRITKPTTGHARIRGRVGSLLEVGTGFHPELTGRENVFLNGAVLGMRRAEIKRKFDEIVEFSGVERFLDTPVKRYSSGMRVRLAFAVAAHLDPEILLIDEVLAVGDADFQKKCLGKMGEAAHGGRTVLFVSHNMQTLGRLCSRGILLERGAIVEDGAARDVIASYLRVGMKQGAEIEFPRPVGAHRAFVSRLRIENDDGTPASAFPIGCPWQVRVLLEVGSEVRRLKMALAIERIGIRIQKTVTPAQDCLPGKHQVLFKQDSLYLAPGEYTLSLNLADPGGRFFKAPECAVLTVLEVPGRLAPDVVARDGVILNTMHVEMHSQ